MFNMGPVELIIILAVALIIIGPKKLPDLARSLGKALGEFKRATNDFKNSIDVDTTIGDVHTAIDEINDDVRDAVITNEPAPEEETENALENDEQDIEDKKKGSEDE